MAQNVRRQCPQQCRNCAVECYSEGNDDIPLLQLEKRTHRGISILLQERYNRKYSMHTGWKTVLSHWFLIQTRVNVDCSSAILKIPSVSKKILSLPQDARQTIFFFCPKRSTKFIRNFTRVTTSWSPCGQHRARQQKKRHLGFFSRLKSVVRSPTDFTSSSQVPENVCKQQSHCHCSVR